MEILKTVLLLSKVFKEEVLNIYKKQPLQVYGIYRSENWKLFNPPYNPSIRLEKPYIFHNFGLGQTRRGQILLVFITIST